MYKRKLKMYPGDVLLTCCACGKRKSYYVKSAKVLQFPYLCNRCTRMGMRQQLDYIAPGGTVELPSLGNSESLKCSPS